jgi:integrase
MEELASYLTPQTLEKWNGRHEVWRRSVSKSYQRTTRHLLPLHDVADENCRISAFFDLCDLLEWGPPSRERNFRAFVAGAAVLNRPITPLEKATMKLLHVEAKSRLPERFTVALSEEQYSTTRDHLVQLGFLDAVLLLDISFLLGQRVGDTIRLRRTDISQIEDCSTATTFLALTLFEGKTVRRTQPFTVHLPHTCWAAKCLRGEVGAVVSPSRESIFPNKIAVYKRLRASLPKVSNLLSIRKGGLQRMVLHGCSTPTVLHHSRHTSAEMLDRYLDYGRVNLWGVRDLQVE